MAIYNLEALDQVTVQAAIDAATSGDTINLPSGSATWTTTVSIPNGKKIYFNGAGKLLTTITSSLTVALNVIYNDSVITNIGFILNSTLSSTRSGIQISGQGWVIAYCHFYTPSDPGGTVNVDAILAISDNESSKPVGLYHNCTFVNNRPLVLGYTGLLAHETWREDLNLGQNNAVFGERNTFYNVVFNNALDGNYGARVVFRYNVVNDAYLETHAVQGNNRALRAFEIYNNTINQVNLSMWTPFFIRGGTGVIYNNVVTGSWTKKKITLNSRREQSTFSVSGIADGSSLWDGNEAIPDGTGSHTGSSGSSTLTDSTKTWTIDALIGLYLYNTTDGSSGYINDNTADTITVTLAGGTDNDFDSGDEYIITNGYPARDMPSTSTDDWLWTTENPYPTQSIDPIYGWNNKDDSDVDVLFDTHATGVIPHIQADRNYYNNTEKSGYSAYTYPHPNSISHNPTFTVLYHGNGKTDGYTTDDYIDYEENDTVTVKSAGSLERSGYNFLGWNTDKDAESALYDPDDTFTMPDNNVTLYAIWESTAPVYEKFGVETESSSSQTFANTRIYFISSGTPEYSGRTVRFNVRLGSFSGGDARLGLYAGTTPENATLVTSAEVSMQTSVGSVSVKQFTIEADIVADQKYWFAVQDKDGYSNKYIHDGTGQTLYYKANTYADGFPETMTGTSTTASYGWFTIFAEYSPTTYNVIYDGNTNDSGTVPTDANEYKPADTITVKSKGSLGKVGYRFKNWNTQANGSGTAYDPDDTFAMGSADITLYAIWEKIYTVTYDGNENTGGSIPLDSNEYIEDDEATVLDNTGNLVKTGYTFNGWNTAADGSGTSYSADDTITIATTDITLYAQWLLMPQNKIKAKLNLNNSLGV